MAEREAAEGESGKEVGKEYVEGRQQHQLL